jgi:nitronate monooxygenase
LNSPDPLARFQGRLSLPLIAAPMFLVSGVDLVVAACRNGVIGAFPTVNCRSPEQLDAWLGDIEGRLRRHSDQSGKAAAPVCPNLIVHRSNARLDQDLQVLLRHRPEIVITSVGSPAGVLVPLHDAGTLVFADVASIRHAERAVEAGADGLVLLTAGAGGQTGWLNPFVFVRAVRAFFDGPIVLAEASATAMRCGRPRRSAAISPIWAPSSSPPTRAWPISGTRKCWLRAAPTISF